MEPIVLSCTDTTELYFSDKTERFCALPTVLSYTNLMNILGVYISQNSPQGEEKNQKLLRCKEKNKKSS